MKNLEFEIYTDEGKKNVRIKWRDRILYPNILKDETGNEFFYVPNYLSRENDDISDTLFIRKIKDMVETVKNGDGDAILYGPNPFGTSYEVAYYLDRNIGEKIRAKTLEEFKDLEFRYALYIPGPLGGLVYAKDGSTVLYCDIRNRNKLINKNIELFNTEEEAKRGRDNFYKKAKDCADKLSANLEAYNDISNSSIINILGFNEDTNEFFVYHSFKIIQIIKGENLK